MKNTNFLLTGAAALVALIAVAGIASFSFASNGDGQGPPAFAGNESHVSPMNQEEREEWRNTREERRSQFQEHREEARDALEEGDYQAWSEAVGDSCPMADRVNEDNFSEFKRYHDSRQETHGTMRHMGPEHFGPNEGHMGGHMGMGYRR